MLDNRSLGRNTHRNADRNDASQLPHDASLRRRVLSGISSALKCRTKRKQRCSPRMFLLVSMTIVTTLFFWIKTKTDFNSQQDGNSQMTVSGKCVAERNKQRSLHLTDSCSTSPQVWTPQAENYSKDARPWNFMFVNDELKLLYCGVPKVATTNWKRILLVLSGGVYVDKLEDLKKDEVHAELQRSFLTPLWSFKPEEIKMRLDTYFKFMFVRHPIERVVSAYEDMLNTSDSAYYRDNVAATIKSRYTKDLKSELDFSEFVRYLGENRQIGEYINQHWRPQVNLCVPCQVRYDVIGKYETLAEDYRLVLDYISKQAKGNKRLETLVSHVYFPPSGHRINQTARAISRFAAISAESLKLMNELYADDYKHFAYRYGLTPDGTLSDYHHADDDHHDNDDRLSGECS